MLQDEFEGKIVALGENLKRLRRDKNLTQGELAELSNIRVGQISKIERNEVDPKLSTIYGLINALECTPNSLLNDISETNLDGLMEMVLERTNSLSDREKNVLIDVIDKYCIAVSMQKLIDREDNKIFGLTNIKGKNEEMTKWE
ncbi:MAG: helix-turn-helix domain-containing protein [Vibrio litoralis]|uniref:helix-turn-helix domain-containing protein n=1 Tax=Vibrio litoralis TaxID=335972 RepID=UPI003F9DB59B